jgi:hypothetical protein
MAHRLRNTDIEAESTRFYFLLIHPNSLVMEHWNCLLIVVVRMVVQSFILYQRGAVMWPFGTLNYWQTMKQRWNQIALWTVDTDCDILITHTRSRWPSGLKAWTVLARFDAGIVGWNPTRGMDVYSMLVLSCGGRGLAMSWSPIQGILPTVLD